MKPTFWTGFWVLLFTTFSVSAQLPDFTLTVAATDETCAGNGQLTFTTTGTLPGSTILFSVYLQPDTNNPVYSGSSTTFATAAGTYNVVAVETLNGETNIQQQNDIVINDNTDVSLVLDIVQSTSSCDGSNVITVNVISGTAVLYEISSANYSVPPQASNVFTNVPDGVYIIRAYDACGQNVPRTFTVEANNSPPVISNPIFDEVITGDCNSVTITNTFTNPEGVVIQYPITITYTIHPGDGSADIVNTQTYTSGSASSLSFSHVFILVPGRTDTYDITVTNGCGTTSPVKAGMAVTPVPTVNMTKVPLPCGMFYIDVQSAQYKPPYNLTFTGVLPNGFNPQTFNANHPGPFTENVVSYGGTGQPVPEGTYNVQLTDACGRTATGNITISNDVPNPVAMGRNNGCFSGFGSITVRIPNRRLVSASIISFTSPTGVAFPQPLPYDVTSFIINGDVLVVIDLPIGNYVLRLTDDCGQIYNPVNAEIPPFVSLDFVASSKADCSPGMAGISVMSPNGPLTSISIVDAPAGYNNDILPIDVTAFLSRGILYMNNFIAGDYTFKGTDTCGIEKEVTITALIYVPGAEPLYTLHANCNSFDLTLSDSDATSDSPTYWLQVENPAVPGQWLHPLTGIVYTEGTLPDNTTGIALVNNQTNINLAFSGNFRILKAFVSIGNGTAVQNCIVPLSDPFEYNDSVSIDNVFRLSCGAHPDDVYIDAEGTEPLTYFVMRDGDAAFTSNGTSNVFSNLRPGIYTFKVENPCGQNNIVTRDISTLPDIVTTNQPDDIVVCIDQGSSIAQEVDLSTRTAQILGTQSPDVYNVTYYGSASDADAAINELPAPYITAANEQTIYARVINNFINVCPKIVSFKVWVSQIPRLTIEDQQFICLNNGNLVLQADAGFDEYTWTSTQPFTQISDAAIQIHDPGEYTVVVKNYYGSPAQACESTVTVTVTAAGPPENVVIRTEDWTEHDNVIKVNLDNPERYEYSLDDINYQLSPVFTNLDTGIYRVYVRDRALCSTSPHEVVLLNYPKYFTPNGDGVNETWHIKYSMREPGMIVYVYDKYGKLISNFDALSGGWDGTFNGSPLPATDYWFVVNRQDGRVFKGHFSLVR
ncbi:hypothetical protein Q765_13180 [Flavobacterium rivuli WB 3.3-2 = DSM 21788]|uniref:T9SS type B sorting domain-containing protein n=1 Tax=Flavobacterium rivuli WB 3.3-2 = DSM 21788 TaxID=1121895 RepID=A0A0A2M3G0_9FLAO|nr:T9SS type B sorting domain-containing protein [Flavobacterium rivuli]KGO86008.1 hypothetical protein Q765_13180 [Flavobacterium rivuli WB 3.3-2 = DSM 21788]